MKNDIKLSKISNWMTIAYERMSEVDSVIVQIAVPVGSQNELREEGGISHFLEHMAFKGTNKRTYKQLAEEVDNVGGITNAFTSKDCTQYYIKVLKKDVEMVFDILSDMLFNSSYPQEEIEKERGVILQEKAMYEDDPSSVNEDLFYLKAYGDTAFGRSIIGTTENIKRFNRDDFINYRLKNYKTEEMVIGVCGNVEEDKIKDLAEKYFGKHSIKNKDYTPESVVYTGGKEVKFKSDLEQIKFTLGYNGIISSFKDISEADLKKLYAMRIGAKILGAGMSSRLFQEIREKRGLVYYVHTFTEITPQTSLFGVNAGFSPDKIHEFVPALKDEIMTITKQISDNEMSKAINQFEARIEMKREQPSYRVGSNIGDLLLCGRILGDDYLINNIIKKITKQEVMDVMMEVLSGEPTLAVYGDVKKDNEDTLMKGF
ncbi:MAG: insulinase family protein [Rickettsiales bacterium]|nr:insulinase family protein [Rickettsiales bacterium]